MMCIDIDVFVLGVYICVYVCINICVYERPFEYGICMNVCMCMHSHICVYETYIGEHTHVKMDIDKYMCSRSCCVIHMYVIA